MTRTYAEAAGAAVQTVALVTDGVRLEGRLAVPAGAWGLVLMPQPTPGGHDSPRQGYLAQLVRGAGLATAVVDLVGPGAAAREAAVFDNPSRLADRLLAWVDMLRARAGLAPLPLALVAPGTAAAAATLAATRRPGRARALVSVAGRPDLAHALLRALDIPTLLIVGENDTPVLRFNRHALGHLRGVRRLEVIDGAHHHFTEPGALARVAVCIRRWLRRYVRPAELSLERAAPVLLPFPTEHGSISRV